MAVPEVDLDPADFVIVPNVYVLDEFYMTDDEGNIIAKIDAPFIAKTCTRMTEREATTGDLCPIVIGHTEDNPQGEDEVRGPPLIGYFRNWKQLPFFDTGKTAAAPDAWIYKNRVDDANRFPRRSGELWVTKHEIDPVSFLGATTPARDLGMFKIKLNRGGSITYQVGVQGSIFERPVRLAREESPLPTNRESNMADKAEPKQDKPAADPKQSGEAKGVEGKLDMLISMMQSWMESQGAAGAAGANPAEGAEGDDQPLTDDELKQYLAQAGGEGGEGEGGEEDDAEKDKSRKGEEVVKNAAGYAGGDDTHIGQEMVKKMARIEEENAVIRLKLARADVRDRLRKAADEDGANLDPNDDKLITELVAMPEDLRESMVVRLSRNKSRSAAGNSGHAAAANASSRATGKRVSTDEDRKQVMKLARQKGIQYEDAATELGFTVG